MTKEKAIMELIDKSQEIEALESCIKILEGWSETTELAKPLKEKQGTKVVVTGRIQTGSYTNRDGQKVYTTDVIVEEQEFAESKKAAGQQDGNNGGYSDAGDGFMNIPDGIDEELPFN